MNPDTKKARKRYGLGVLISATSKTYVIVARLKGRDVRIPIGDPANWSERAAQTEARRLLGIIADGIDPRGLPNLGRQTVGRARNCIP